MRLLSLFFLPGLAILFALLQTSSYYPKGQTIYMSGLLIRSGRSVLTQIPVAYRQWAASPTICWFQHNGHYFTSQTISEDAAAPSGRSLFKQAPVHPSILRYIQSVGVGKAQRIQRRKLRRKKEDSRFLDSKGEQAQFNRIRPKMSNIPPAPFLSHKNSRNEKLESGKVIRRFPVKLIRSVGSLDQKFPNPLPNLPEVAIAGRSNVGKSTLLNALLYGSNEQETENLPPRLRSRKVRPTSQTARLPKGLKATTSSKPGHTREISFYKLSAKLDAAKVSLLLVDLPGYGFAFASEDKAKEWQSLMKSYILGRGKSLKRILLLIDSRHGMKKADIEFLEDMQQSLVERRSAGTVSASTQRELPPIQLVLTKCDLVSQSDLARRVVMVQKQLSDCLRRQPGALPVMLVSAQVEGQAGVVELQKELAALIPKVG